MFPRSHVSCLCNRVPNECQACMSRSISSCFAWEDGKEAQNPTDLQMKTKSGSVDLLSSYQLARALQKSTTYWTWCGWPVQTYKQCHVLWTSWNNLNAVLGSFLETNLSSSCTGETWKVRKVYLHHSRPQRHREARDVGGSAAVERCLSVQPNHAALSPMKAHSTLLVSSQSSSRLLT